MNGDFNGTLPAKGDLKTSPRAVSSRLGVKKDFRLTLRIFCQVVLKPSLFYSCKSLREFKFMLRLGSNRQCSSILFRIKEI